MAEVLQFPFENTKEYKEIQEELSTFSDKEFIDQHVYNAIVDNVAHISGAKFDFAEEDTLKLVALIARIHRVIANKNLGYRDPLEPFLYHMVEELDLKKIQIVDD